MRKSVKKTKLTALEIFKHIVKYGQYSQNQSWAEWYSKIASLKAKRVTNVLLTYRDKNSKVLDLGCGIGLTLAGLAQTFNSCVGCDIGNKEIEASKELLKKLKLKAPVIKYDGKKLPFANNNFDIVTSIEVIEHVENPSTYLREIKRVLKKDGILHITTANKWWPVEPHFKLPFLSYLPSKMADFYVKTTGKGNDYQNIKLPSYTQFYKMANRYFEVEDITLNVISEYKKYGLDKERGKIILYLARLLKFLNRMEKNSITKFPALFIKYLLRRFSLGWLFICYQKK